MAKPAHIRITYSGITGTPAAAVEEWSFNVNAEDRVDQHQATQAQLDLMSHDAHDAYAVHLAPQMPEDVYLLKTRVALVDDTGHVRKRPDGSYVQGDDITGPINGPKAKQPMPLQTALCVSLVSGRAGPTGKGRFFLPWPGLSLDPDDKRVPVAQIDVMKEAVRNFLNYLVTGSLDAHVVSSKGYVSRVTSFRVGRVPDTMRSRREDSPEGYVTGVVNP